jgi:hypothetical protein
VNEPGPCPLKDSVVSKCNLLDTGRVGQHGDDNIGSFCHLPGQFSAGSPKPEDWVNPFGQDVRGNDVVAGALEMGRHVLPHGPQADEANAEIHFHSLC